jgi:predicted transposase YbfD/YdcC
MLGTARSGSPSAGLARLAMSETQTHNYISNLPTQASLLLAVIRAHWSIENQCHWVLEVVFHEAAGVTCTRVGDHNLTLLRKIALNEDFLLEVMQSSFNLMR